jgi:membrane protein
VVDSREGCGDQLVGPQDARQGAALAYYSVFSLGPIIVIAIAIAGLFFSHEAVTS